MLLAADASPYGVDQPQELDSPKGTPQTKLKDTPVEQLMQDPEFMIYSYKVCDVWR
jgi:hypothetical protein